MSQINCIIFDMGNVLLEFNPMRIVSKYTSDYEAQAILLEEIFHTQVWVGLDLGVITDQEAEKKIWATCPDSLHDLVHEIISTWPKTNIIIDEMRPLVMELKDKGYQLYLASNASVRFYEYQSSIKALDSFDGILISAEIHKAKPDPLFYEALIERFHLKPSNCFMIDDMSANILGAAACGIKGIVYDGQIDHLRAALKRMGLI